MAEEKRIAVYPGSFDPVTRGHLDVIERGLRLFDRLVVGVVVNLDKEPLLSEEERVDLLRKELAGEPRAEVRSFRGLVVDLAAEVGARWVLRGVRAEADFSSELPMALSNRALRDPPVDTVFLPARHELAFISSRLVRDVARFGGDLKPFLTPRAAKALLGKMRGRG